MRVCERDMVDDVVLARDWGKPPRPAARAATRPWLPALFVPGQLLGACM